MLDKGPMIVAAITTLDDILTRMARHRHKKTSLLGDFTPGSPEPTRLTGGRSCQLQPGAARVDAG